VLPGWKSEKLEQEVIAPGRLGRKQDVPRFDLSGPLGARRSSRNRPAPWGPRKGLDNPCRGHTCRCLPPASHLVRADRGRRTQNFEVPAERTGFGARRERCCLRRSGRAEARDLGRQPSHPAAERRMAGSR
jgi:hypothetical protein